MNISIRKLTLSTLCVFLGTIPQIYAKTNEPDDLAALTAPTVTIPDSSIVEAKKQMDQLQVILSGIAIMISEKQIIPINKKDTLENIRQMNSFIQTFQHQRLTGATPEMIDFTLRLNRMIISHILQACKNGFATVAPFDPAPLLKRGPSQKVELHQLQRLLLKNRADLKRLNKQIETAGLTRYNIAYRKLDKYVVDPCIKYSIPSRGLIAGAVAASALSAWWYLYNDKFCNTNFLPEAVKNFYGERPNWSPGTDKDTITNLGKLGLFGRAEYYASLIPRNLLPITGSIGTFATTQLLSEYKELKPKFDKKIQVWVNKLKGGAYLKEAQKAADIVDEVYFDDLVGLDHVKAHFKQLIEYLEKPEQFDRSGLTPPKGILLIGDTRTGKSYSIKALFGEISRMLKRTGRAKEFSYLHLDAPKITLFGIGNILHEIKRKAPCIVFIDEIDLLDLQRKGKNEMLSEFLTYMSGVTQSKDPKNQVIIIGATNMPQTLDSALRQPGRFAVELVYTYPTFEERKLAFVKNLSKLSLDIRHFDLDRLARQTEAQSHEAISMVIRNAVVTARMEGEVISQQHIEHTIDQELRNIVTHSSPQIASHQKQMLAAHFAGHALALHLLDTYTKLSKVTIKDVKSAIREELTGLHLFPALKDGDNEKGEHATKQRLEHGKVFTEHPDDSIDLYTHDEKLALIKFHLAGIVAEEIVLGSCGYSCHRGDKKAAFALAQSLVDQGIDASKAPKKFQQEIFAKANQMVEKCKSEVCELLTKHKKALTTLTNALHEQETLDNSEVEMVTYFSEHPEELEKLREMGKKKNQQSAEAEAEADEPKMDEPQANEPEMQSTNSSKPA